jgi:hypothetical protein
MKLGKMALWGCVGIITVFLIATPRWEYVVFLIAWIYLAIDNR